MWHDTPSSFSDRILIFFCSLFLSVLLAIIYYCCCCCFVMWCLLFQHPISFTIDDDPAQYIKQYWSVLLLLFLWSISFAIHILSVNCRCFAINAGVDAISTPVRTCFALNTQPTPHSLSHIQARTHTHIST